MQYFVIRLVAFVGQVVVPNKAASGSFLKGFDPEVAGGLGMAVWTEDKTQAMHFDSAVEAFDCYRTQSKTMPFRPDGKPNRPLTAFTVSIEPIEY